jgi:hypothetical protein
MPESKTHLPRVIKKSVAAFAAFSRSEPPWWCQENAAIDTAKTGAETAVGDGRQPAENLEVRRPDPDPPMPASNGRSRGSWTAPNLTPREVRHLEVILLDPWPTESLADLLDMARKHNGNSPEARERCGLLERSRTREVFVEPVRTAAIVDGRAGKTSSKWADD